MDDLLHITALESDYCCCSEHAVTPGDVCASCPMHGEEAEREQIADAAYMKGYQDGKNFALGLPCWACGTTTYEIVHAPDCAIALAGIEADYPVGDFEVNL